MIVVAYISFSFHTISLL